MANWKFNHGPAMTGKVMPQVSGKLNRSLVGTMFTSHSGIAPMHKRAARYTIKQGK